MSTSGVEKRGSGATVKACDSCRRRKRKCAWTPGAEGCAPCLASQEECSTTHIRKPRAKSHKRANRIAEYESRIQRLESLLEEQTTAQPQIPEQPLQPADQSVPLSNYISNLNDEIISWPLEEGPRLSFPAFDAGFEYDDASLQISPAGSLTHTTPEGTFWPSTSSEGFSDLSLGPSIPTTVNSNDAIIGLDLQPNPPPKMQITHQQPPLVRAKCDGYLPPPDLGISLMREFLVDFNTAVPLYRPYLVAEHLRVCYAGESDGTIISWTTTYVVFGIAHRLRAMSTEATPRDNEQADYYLRRIIQNVSELLLEPPSMEVVQCLLGLATLVQTSSYSRGHASFVPTALRMAQSLAYSGEQAQSTPSGLDYEQQRRIFWIAFIIDTGASVQSTIPTAHRREDLNAAQPNDTPQDPMGALIAAEGNWQVDIFSLRRKLAILQAEAIETVFSGKSHARDLSDLRAAALTCLRNLQRWREHEIFKLDVAQLQQLLYRSDLVHVLELESSYFATLYRVQASIALGVETKLNPFSANAMAVLAEQSQNLAHSEAKRFLDLLSLVPQGDVGISWTIITPVSAALLTVLAQDLQTSRSPNPALPGPTPMPAEMHWYKQILNMMNLLAQKSGDVELQRVRDLCMGLYSRLEAVVTATDMSIPAIPRVVTGFAVEQGIF